MFSSAVITCPDAGAEDKYAKIQLAIQPTRHVHQENCNVLKSIGNPAALSRDIQVGIDDTKKGMKVVYDLHMD
jgi:hypothetical protein